MIILLLLLLILFFLLRELKLFFPGMLGAVTLYILSIGSYSRLVNQKKWRKGWTAGLYLLAYFSLLAILVYFVFILVEQKIQPFLSDPATVLAKARAGINEVQQRMNVVFISPASLNKLQQQLSDFIPGLLNDTWILLSNLATMLFILYYMLVHGAEMENFLGRVIPLRKSNVSMLAYETKRLVKASALGIPIISVIQGITATIGYVLFGVHEYVIWGFLTGVFAFFPVVGTLIVWVPLVLYMYSSGDSWNAAALTVYSLIVTGNIDYIARITLLKKFGNVHPVVTILGVIAGLGMFGFIGFIFGPLLVNYVILLTRIYLQEFSHADVHPPPAN